MVDTSPVAESNADRVRDVFAIYERGDFDALLALADPEIEIRNQTSVIEAGEFRGVEDGLRMIASWEEAWADAGYELVEIEEIDDETLIVEIEMKVRGEGSGAAVSANQWWLFGIRGGRFTRWHLYLDRASALEAARR